MDPVYADLDEDDADRRATELNFIVAEEAIRDQLACKFLGLPINDISAVSMRVFRPHPKMVSRVDVGSLLEPLMVFWLAIYHAVTMRGLSSKPDEQERIKLVFLRATPGLGKTHFFNLLCRVSDLVKAYEELPPSQQDKFASHRIALNWASANIVFPITFNGLCRLDLTVESTLVRLKAAQHGGRGRELPVLLRFLFVGLFPIHTRQTWGMFVRACQTALSCGKLTGVEVREAVDNLFQRL